MNSNCEHDPHLLLVMRVKLSNVVASLKSDISFDLNLNLPEKGKLLFTFLHARRVNYYISDDFTFHCRFYSAHAFCLTVMEVASNEYGDFCLTVVEVASNEYGDFCLTVMEVASNEYGDYTHKMVTAVYNSKSENLVPPDNTRVMKNKATANGEIP